MVINIKTTSEFFPKPFVIKEGLFTFNQDKMNFNDFQNARIKLELGDILVFQQKFNEALIYLKCKVRILNHPSSKLMNLKTNCLSVKCSVQFCTTTLCSAILKAASKQTNTVNSD